MAGLVEVAVPDIGDFDDVDVIEILVAVGDHVAIDDSLVTLESDKASMEIPSPAAGTVTEIRVALGDKVGEGAVIAVLEPALVPAAGEQASESGASEVTAAEEGAPAAPLPAVPSLTQPALDEAPADADYDFDCVVIGAGPGGYTAAFRAADLGLRVALVERYSDLGGVCLNVGCIPSKALLHVAKVIEEAEAAAQHGVTFGAPKIDLDRLRGFKEGVVGKLTGGLAQLAKRRKVRVITGVARFVSPHRLEVLADDASTSEWSFAHAIVAVGSRAVELPFLPHDDERVMTSTGALALSDIPKSLLVIGGGIIGLEMATVYAALGTRVSLVELLPRIMAGADADLVRPLAKRLEATLENIWLETKVTGAKALKKGIKVTFEGEDAPASATFDRVLVAVGRRPNGTQVGAEAAGLPVTERGFIEVDRQMRTAVPHIFAIGDVVGEPMLAHKATHEGKVAAEVIAGLKSGFDATVIPSVAYTDPEVAWVGLTEEEAKARGAEYEKGTFPWAASGRALAMGRGEGITKLLFDPRDERILGAGIVGPNAGDLIAEVVLAIEMGADARDIGLSIHPHPTLSETVALGAEGFEGTITDLYVPRKKPKKAPGR